MKRKLMPWEVEQLHQAGYGTHTEIMAREEFQGNDEPKEINVPFRLAVIIFVALVTGFIFATFQVLGVSNLLTLINSGIFGWSLGWSLAQLGRRIAKFLEQKEGNRDASE